MEHQGKEDVRITGERQEKKQSTCTQNAGPAKLHKLDPSSARTSSPLHPCALLQVSSVSSETSAQPTPAPMAACAWPHTPRSSVAVHLASRVTPANATSMSASWSQDPALRALPAITPWAPSSVSALWGRRARSASSGRDPALLEAVSTEGPASWCRRETPPFISASVPQVESPGSSPTPLSLSREGPLPWVGSVADPKILAGFTGLNCEMNPDDCVRHQCQNGATCLDGLGTYTCLCPKAWKGRLFKASSWQQQQRLPHPTPRPPSSPRPALVPLSTPPAGWDCSEDIDECEAQGPPRCRNGGTCQNSAGDFHCVCVSGWGGPGCDENLDDCAAATCAPGSTCIDRVGSFSCLCPPGRTGAGRRCRGGVGHGGQESSLGGATGSPKQPARALPLGLPQASCATWKTCV